MDTDTFYIPARLRICRTDYTFTRDGGIPLDLSPIFSVAGAIIATDFALAIKRPSLHERFQNALSNVAGMAMMFAGGVWIGTVMVEESIADITPGVQTAIDTVSRFGITIGATALLVLVCHMVSLIVASISREDQQSSADRDG